MRLILRFVLLTGLGVLAVAFLANAAFLLGNYFFEWRPDKISLEWQLSLLLAAYSLLFGFSASVLFYALLRRVPWFFRAYGIVWSFTTVWLLTAISPAPKDIPFILGAAMVLALPGLLIRRYSSWLGFRSVA